MTITHLSNSQELFYLGQIALAMLLGAFIGLQRERSGKVAGPRTYALVTAGAALFTILGASVIANGATIAAQIVTGIGFLGAGMILHRGDDRIEGLTTAAGLWMMAAVGMAVGACSFILAVGTTVLVYLLLMFNDARFRRK